MGTLTVNLRQYSSSSSSSADTELFRRSGQQLGDGRWLNQVVNINPETFFSSTSVTFLK